jgi:hypothetical protein
MKSRPTSGLALPAATWWRQLRPSAAGAGSVVVDFVGSSPTKSTTGEALVEFVGSRRLSRKSRATRTRRLVMGRRIARGS